jgi:ATP-binding cassette subfamily B protein
MVQDVTSILAQTWTLSSVLTTKGRKANALIALSIFNPVFARWYSRARRHGTTSFPFNIGNNDEAEYEARQRRNQFFSLATDHHARAEVSTFGLKKWVLDTYERISLDLQQASSDTNNQLRLHGSARGFVRHLTEAMSYILVATRYSQDITLATLSLLQSATEDIIWNLEGLYDSITEVLNGLEEMKNYFDFLDPEMNPSSTPRMEPFASYVESTGRGMKIVAKDVTFGYPQEETVLKGISFTIEPGELIAIVGGNGSGKSTLVKLLARMYDVTSGSIEINDIDIRRYDTDELWSHMSTVNQDFGKPPHPHHYECLLTE